MSFCPLCRDTKRLPLRGPDGKVEMGDCPNCAPLPTRRTLKSEPGVSVNMAEASMIFMHQDPQEEAQ